MNLSSILKKHIPFFKNDEFQYWYSNSNLKTRTTKEWETIEKRITQIANIRRNDNKTKVLNEYLEDYINELKENSGYNLIIENLPKKQGKTKVNRDSLYETFKDMGNIFDIHHFNNTAWIWFTKNETAERLHDLINQMQIEDNIITTTYTPTNCIVEHFDWASGDKYNVYSNRGCIIKI